MKKIMNYKVFMVCLFAILIFTGCKKNIHDDSNATKINFTYNGQQYTTTNYTSYIKSNLILPEFIFANFAGLKIDRPDLFGGYIIINSRASGGIECAYSNPGGMSISGPCNNLRNNNNPIDSLAGYWYESGSLNYSYANCTNATEASVPGQKNCLISGSFEVTLVNKNQQKINLTNGSFSGKIRKY